MLETISRVSLSHDDQGSVRLLRFCPPLTGSNFIILVVMETRLSIPLL